MMTRALSICVILIGMNCGYDINEGDIQPPRVLGFGPQVFKIDKDNSIEVEFSEALYQKNVNIRTVLLVPDNVFDDEFRFDFRDDNQKKKL